VPPPQTHTYKSGPCKSINAWHVTGFLSYNVSTTDVMQCQMITHGLGGNKDSLNLCQERRCHKQTHSVYEPMFSQSSRGTQFRLEPVFSSRRPINSSTSETPRTEVLQDTGHQQGGSSYTSCQSYVGST
jgi:hypothetical protein